MNNDIILREASLEDESLLFKWRNIDELVLLSYLKKKVDFDEHHQWFINRVSSNSCKLLIVRIEEIDIGLVRVELNNDECEISIYLIPSYEGKGYGSKALALALDRCSSLCGCYKAIIQKKNVSSINLFKKLGFIEIYQDDVFATYSK